MSVLPHSAYDFTFKFLLVGDSCVGKSCFMLRYADQTFSESHLSTVGLDYRLKSLMLQNKLIKIQIWDTAGQDRFRCITKSYYKGANGIILMYDVTSLRSFNNVHTWISQIKEHASDKVKVILVGNKIDMQEGRVIPYEQGLKLAKKSNFEFFESSAKENSNVEESFTTLSDSVFNEISVYGEESGKSNQKKINISGKKRKLAKCCKA